MPKIPVTIYTTPNCMQCETTKRTMTRYNIEYTVVSLTPEKAAEFKKQGFMQAPIVTTDTKIWSGFKLGKIQSLAHHLFGEQKNA